MRDSILQLLGQTSTPMAPAAILALCVVAGVGTVLLLPGRREASWGKIGAVVLLAAGLVFAAILVHWAAAAEGVGVYFWIFSAIALVGAVRVITHPVPVYSALYFVLTVFASAGLFLLMRAEFMAAALVLIYAGAILITYVFVIMLAAEVAKPGVILEHDQVSRDPALACAIGFALMGVLLFVVFDNAAAVQTHTSSADLMVVTGSTQKLGEFLFTNQLMNLELAGLILTIAMVGAILISRRKVWTLGVEVGSSDEVVLGPSTPLSDDPHSVPVVGTSDARQKEYPET